MRFRGGPVFLLVILLLSLTRAGIPAGKRTLPATPQLEALVWRVERNPETGTVTATDPGGQKVTVRTEEVVGLKIRDISDVPSGPPPGAPQDRVLAGFEDELRWLTEPRDK